VLRVHTTCPTCLGGLDAAAARTTTHPGCPPTPEHQLQQRFLSAAQAGDDALADEVAGELDAYHHRAPQHLLAAYVYLGWGWPVFPVRPGRKTPLTEHGLLDASTDPDVIAAWWQRWPDANIGLPTGARFDVIDVDPAGLPWLAYIRADPELTIDVHGLVSTPRGGQHLYVAPTGSGNTAALAPGVDYRGHGGYVVAPPSTLAPHALRPPAPPWPLRYDWLALPSPAICADPEGGAA
jgi:hypothetical protein